MKKNWDYFLGLFLLMLYLFKNAFSIKLFQDDYFFMQITNVNNFSGFLNFFNPIRDYSYKPLPTEVFYFLFQKLGNNFFIAHTLIFVTFFIGLIFLYKIIEQVTKNEVWAKITTLFYGISFVHVFQLYWLATYQEVLMFTLLTTSFYKYLNNKIIQAIGLFVLALFCKETAVLYVAFLLVWEFISKKRFKNVIGFLVFGIAFYMLYRYSLSYVTSNPNYAMDFRNIKLLLNNCVWYMLWALGLPNFLFLYLPSLTSKPIPEFWILLENASIKNYFISLIVYYSLTAIGFVILLVKDKDKKPLKILLFSLIGFYLFLGPILFFMHKWMVRLTIPLVFISLFQGYIVARLFKLNINKIFLYFMVIFYLLFNYFGTLVHESSSNYFDETKVFNNMEKILQNNKAEVLKRKGIFLEGDMNERLRNTLHDQSYVKYFFPSENIKTYYPDIYKDQPQDTFRIKMNDLFK